MRRLVLLGISGLLLTAACGDDDGNTFADKFTTIEGFCAEAARVVCNEDVVQACYLSTPDDIADDRSSCIEAYQLPENCNPSDNTYNASAAPSCVTELEKAYGDARLSRAELDSIDELCAPVLSGAGVAGDACTSSADCDTGEGFRCWSPPGGSLSCQIIVQVGPGEDCAGAGSECGKAQYCGSNNNCISREMVGEACSPTLLCALDALCDDTTSSCQPRGANGQPCAADNECVGGFCTGAPSGTCGGQQTLAPSNGNTCTPLLPK